MNKHITIKLSTKSINKAIKEIQKIQQTEDPLRKVAEKICERAQQYYDSAWYDDLPRGVRNSADVVCTVEQTPTGYRVVATGEHVAFIEFGAGVYHNGAAGNSPHPKGAELGFTIGSYGKGYGKYTSWGYYGDDGQAVITHGTAAQMPLYNAFRDVVEELRL